MATQWLKDILNDLFDELIKDGKKVITNAATSTDLRRPIVSGNMQDAYGAAVYFNGQIVRKAYYNDSPIANGPHKGWRKRNIEPNTGRGYLDDFFNSYMPTNKVCLVCVNAVYYTTILEEGAQGRPQIPLSTKYHIISQVGVNMDNLQRKYKGSRLGRITYRNS